MAAHAMPENTFERAVVAPMPSVEVPSTGGIGRLHPNRTLRWGAIDAAGWHVDAGVVGRNED
jgi:hypothetical protein